MSKFCLSSFFLSGLLAGTLYGQNTQIKGFVNMNISAQFDSSSRKNRIAFGQYDLFITSRITDKLNFLGETVFAYKETKGEFDFGVERAIINYRLKDYFYVTLGKLHLPLGYWNTAFHHGLVIQPVIRRPHIVEDNISKPHLPMEDMAVQVNGDGITKFNLGYNLMAGNGIASNDIEDFNESKALCLNLHAEPYESFKIYFSGYQDIVPSGTTTLQDVVVHQKTRLQILNGSIVYMDGHFPFEFIGEYYWMHTKELDSIRRASSYGYLMYAGYKYKKFNLTPYFLYDVLFWDENQQFFLKDNTSSLTLGLRYSMHPLSVIKLEYKSVETQLRGREYRIELQFAIGF